MNKQYACSQEKSLTSRVSHIPTIYQFPNSKVFSGIRKRTESDAVFFKLCIALYKNSATFLHIQCSRQYHA